MDIFALCQFLANALRGADSFDLLVLKELVETLTGISVPLDPSPEQASEGMEGREGGRGRDAGLCACLHAVGSSGARWAVGRHAHVSTALEPREGWRQPFPRHVGALGWS